MALNIGLKMASHRTSVAGVRSEKTVVNIVLFFWRADNSTGRLLRSSKCCIRDKFL